MKLATIIETKQRCFLEQKLQNCLSKMRFLAAYILHKIPIIIIIIIFLLTLKLDAMIVRTWLRLDNSPTIEKV